MKNNVQKNKNDPVFAVIDFAVFLAFILIVSFFVKFFLDFIGIRKTSQDTQILYNVKMTAVRSDVSENIKEGDTVIDSVGKYEIGTVESVSSEKITKSAKSTKSAKGDAAPDLCDVTVKIRASASLGKDIKIDGYTVKIGKKMYIRMPYFVGEGYCTGIYEAT